MKHFSLFACVAMLVVGCATMEEKYQRDMDRVRITHVDYLASLTREYLQKNGRLPLADRFEGKTVMVFVTHRSLDSTYLEQAARLPVVVLSTSDLTAELEKGLGRPIVLPSDPQNYPSYAPNLYLYDVNAARSCVAGHLYFKAPGSYLVEGKTSGTQTAKRYYKYEHCIPGKAA